MGRPKGSLNKNTILKQQQEARAAAASALVKVPDEIKDDAELPPEIPRKLEETEPDE